MGIEPLPKTMSLKNAILGPCEEVACSVQDTSLNLLQLFVCIHTREPALFSGAEDHYRSGNLPRDQFRHTFHQKSKIKKYPYREIHFSGCVVSRWLFNVQWGNFTLHLSSVQSEALEVPTEVQPCPLTQSGQQQNLGSSQGFHWSS